MRNILIAVTTVLLCACTTAAALREEGPLVKFKSNKTQSSVAACIKEAFIDAHGEKSVEVSKRVDGAISISMGDPKSPVRVIIVDVFPTDFGSESKLYFLFPTHQYLGSWIKPANNCQ